MSRRRKKAFAFLAVICGIALLQPLCVSAAVIEGDAAGLSVSRTVSPAVGKDNAMQVECKITGAASGASEPADIVLVLDTSGSMLKKNKAQNMQGAASEFVNSVLGEGSACRISLVSFALRAQKITDFMGASGRKDLVFEIKHLSFANGTADGTNIQDGIHTAQQLLDAQNDQSRKIIILLSDGYPNVSFRGLSSAKYSGFAPVSGVERHAFRLTSFDYKKFVTSDCLYKLYGKKYRAGDATVSDHGIAVLSEAYFAKSAGTSLYTVGFDVSADAAARYVLLNCADSTTHFYTAGIQDLTAAFGKIGAEVTSSNGCTIQDAIQEGYELDMSKGDPSVFDAADYTTTCGAAYYDRDKGSVRWVTGNLSSTAENTLHYTILKKKDSADTGLKITDEQNPPKAAKAVTGKFVFKNVSYGVIQNPNTGEKEQIQIAVWSLTASFLLAFLMKLSKFVKKKTKS